jgi:hypothetical protein
LKLLQTTWSDVGLSFGEKGRIEGKKVTKNYPLSVWLEQVNYNVIYQEKIRRTSILYKGIKTSQDFLTSWVLEDRYSNENRPERRFGIKLYICDP